MEIPFELRDGLICLNVKVTSTSSPLRFVLDSGAGMSALNLDAARKLKVKLGAPAFVVGVEGGAQARWVHGFAAKIGDVPLIGDVGISSALVFDTGVYLAVVGMVLMAFEAFGEDLEEVPA